MKTVLNNKGEIVEDDKEKLKIISDPDRRLLFIEMSNYTYNHWNSNPPHCTNRTKIKFNSELFLNDFVLHYSDGTIIGYS